MKKVVYSVTRYRKDDKVWLPYANRTLKQIPHKEVKIMANYYRITAYHPTEDYCFIVDSHGRFEKIWEFSSYLVNKGVKVLEVANGDNFLDGNMK